MHFVPPPFAYGTCTSARARTYAFTVHRHAHHEARLTRPPTPRSGRPGKLAPRFAGAATRQRGCWGAAQDTCASKVTPGQAHGLGTRSCLAIASGSARQLTRAYDFAICSPRPPSSNLPPHPCQAGPNPCHLPRSRGPGTDIEPAECAESLNTGAPAQSGYRGDRAFPSSPGPE